MRRAILVIFSSALFASSYASGSEGRCSTQEEIAAQHEAVNLDDVGALYQSFKKFHHCDDGAISEGYNEAVVRVLSKHWEQIIELHRLTSTDKEFAAFVLRHVNEAMTPKQRAIIVKNAAEDCPKVATNLCRNILRAMPK
jgi:hypothetical protein